MYSTYIPPTWVSCICPTLEPQCDYHVQLQLLRMWSKLFSRWVSSGKLPSRWALYLHLHLSGFCSFISSNVPIARLST